MSGYLPPGCTQWECDEAQQGDEYCNEKPDPEAERAEYEDRMAQLCIACANGNDLPEGEACAACRRVGAAIHDHGLRLRDVSHEEVRDALSPHLHDEGRDA